MMAWYSRERSSFSSAASLSREIGWSALGFLAISLLRDLDWRDVPDGKLARRKKVPSDHLFPAHAAAIHLELEPAHGRPAEMPGQPGARRAAAHDLVGQERKKV